MKNELTVHAVHQGAMRVLASDGEFRVAMDYPMVDGESTTGPTPLTMLLASLAACSLNSVAVILKKMQQPLAGLGVEARGTRRTEHPTVLTDVSLEFTVKGEVDPAAMARALQLSEDRLCPVWNMLKASTPIKSGFHVQQEAGPVAINAGESTAIDYASVGHGLARLAPERNARIRTLQVMTDGIATAAAGITGTTVDPKAVLRAAAACCATLAAIRDDRVADVFKDIRGDKALSSGDKRGNLLIVQCRDKTERIDTFDKANF
jgi:putative redox protein